jgi:hypothetical protein
MSLPSLDAPLFNPFGIERESAQDGRMVYMKCTITPLRCFIGAARPGPMYPRKTGGAIFERSFIHGVKRLNMLNMHKVCRGTALGDSLTNHLQYIVGPSPSKPSFSGESLVKVAEDLIHDTKTDPCPDGIWEQYPGTLTTSAF